MGKRGCKEVVDVDTIKFPQMIHRVKKKHTKPTFTPNGDVPATHADETQQIKPVLAAAEDGGSDSVEHIETAHADMLHDVTEEIRSKIDVIW